jgi:hypothetical protein
MASEYQDEFVPIPVQVNDAAVYLHIKYPSSLPRKKEESIEVSPVVFHGAPGATADATNTEPVDIPETAARKWEFGFSTESIKVSPKKASIKTDAFNDPIRFHITPTATGSKVVVLQVEFKAPAVPPEAKPGKSDERKLALSRDLRIQVLPRRTALGLDEESVEDIRGVAAVVGLPGLMLLAVTAFRDRRAATGAASSPKPRIMTPS